MRITIAAVFGAVFATGGILIPFLFFFPSLLFDQRLLLLRLVEDGRVGEREVDGDGDGLRIVFLSIKRRLLLLPLL